MSDIEADIVENPDLNASSIADGKNPSLQDDSHPDQQQQGQTDAGGQKREKKTNTMIDQEAVLGEKIEKLRKRRSSLKGHITRVTNEINKLMSQPISRGSKEQAVIKTAEMNRILHSYKQATKEYVECVDELAKEDALDSLVSKESMVYAFMETVDVWSATLPKPDREAPTDEPDVWDALDKSLRPEDSASQSGTSSTSSARKADAMVRKAVLAAKATSLDVKQQLDREKYILQQKQEQLDLKIALDMANAEEDAYERFERGTKPEVQRQPTVKQEPMNEAPTENKPMKPDVSKQPRVNEVPKSEMHTGSEPDALKQSKVTQEPKDEEHTGSKPIQFNLNPLAKEWEQPSKQQIDKSPEVVLLDVIQQSQSQQKQLLETIQLPKADLMSFDGDSLKYWSFMQSFQNSIDKTTVSDSNKLMRLLQFCTGKANRIIQGCAVMKPEEGYKKAKALLAERFGSSHIIADAWIQKITQGSPLGNYDKQGLQDWSDDLQSCKDTLEAMGFKAEISTQRVLLSIAEKLPNYARQRWIKEVHNIRKRKGITPTIEELVTFVADIAAEANDPVYGQLNNTYRSRDNASQWNKPQRRSNFSTQISDDVKGERSGVQREKGNSESNDNSRTDVKKCIICSENHTLFWCKRFRDMKPRERFNLAKDNNLCFNCLGSNHSSRFCRVPRSCSVEGCKRKHTKFLHITEERSQPPKKEENNSKTGKSGTSSSGATIVSCQDKTHVSTVTGAGRVHVALPIVPVQVSNPNSNQSISTYALLDTGSTSTFCKTEIISSLGLKGTKQTLQLSTLSDVSHVDTEVVSLKVTGMDGESVDIPNAYAKSQLPIKKSNMATIEDVAQWPHLKGIPLPNDDAINSIGLLIGLDVPNALTPLEVRVGEAGSPYATRTLLGWTINGPVGPVASINQASVNFVETLESQMERFWKLDGCDVYDGKGTCMSRQDKEVLSLWDHSVKFKNKHYELAIPIKNSGNLPDNRVMAEGRLKSLGRRLQGNSKLHTQYIAGMKDLLDQDYAAKVPDDELQRVDGMVWYLPHHPVWHSRKKDKPRIVFDCAAKYEGISLNENVLQGPDLTNNLLGVLLRFRQRPVALMADIKSMFHQVRVTPRHRDVLRFLWWLNGDLNAKPEVYRMNVHLFGGKWSPSCCSYALRRVSKDSENPESAVAKSILSDFYVDDFLKSLNSSGEGIEIAINLSSLLSDAGFKLTKWVSNDPDVLEVIPEVERAVNLQGVDLTHEALPAERALGVFWDVNNDKFSFRIAERETALTRRGILSTVCSVYDPYGFISPFVMTAKKLLQDLTREKLSWDEVLPAQHVDTWLQWKRSLTVLEKFSVQRCFLHNPKVESVLSYELHHFSDASQIGYGTVSYIRMVRKGQVTCSFVLAKSRLAPIKYQTIPRLELAAAALAISLDGILKQELEVPISRSVFWSDSTCVLQYIRNVDKRFNTFVANRLAIIHSGSNSDQWRHVPSKQNPADDISRGISAQEMLNSNRWLVGPTFLSEPEVNWPKPFDLIGNPMNPKDPELKKAVTIGTVSTVNQQESNAADLLLKQRSSWYKLRKDVFWFLYVKSFLLARIRGQSVPGQKSSLTAKDLQGAEEAIVKYTQQRYFDKEIKQLRSVRGTVDVSSPLAKLSPMLNKEDILVVGGRLANSQLGSRQKHPVILPKASSISKLIVKSVHEAVGHAGKEYVLSELRLNYWLIGARCIIRAVIRECLKCERLSSKASVQRMSDLPEVRVTEGKPPFSVVGVDYFGPCLVKRGRSLVKRYGCVFTCLAIRAIHIEVAHSLNTTSFINALERFTARRGRPEIILSDNGTNFVGAERELREAIEEWNKMPDIQKHLAQRNIIWKFNPPGASHMGGVWERQIRSIRRIISTVGSQQVLDDEAFSTLMCNVEGIINGRPITAVSDHVDDLEALTPNHLLLVRPGPTLPPGMFSESDMYKARWKQVQYLTNIFWQRWLREYLPTLQERQKWLNKTKNLEVGDIVLITEKDQPRNHWNLGRVQEVHIGKDGLCRSARVKTSSSVLVRPITKLALLENVTKGKQ